MSGINRVQVLVVGGGIVGCAVFREFAQRDVEILLVEAEPSICEGASKANSAIIHTGFDARDGSLEADLLRRAAILWPAILEDLAVPYLDVGALMIARDADEARRLRDDVAAKAAKLKVETQLLDSRALREVAPYVTEDAVAALLVPAEAIVDPFWLTRAYAAAGIAAGGQLWTDAAVTGLDVRSDGVAVSLRERHSIEADVVINCAGLWADDIAALAGDRSFSLSPRRGQFLVSEEACGVERIVLPLPGRMGKGMLVTPIVFGGMLLGPTAEDTRDKTDRATDAAARSQILAACTALVPAIAATTPIRQFAGLRAVSSTGDYILRPSVVGDRLYHVAGIRSTGISTSPSVAERAADDVFSLRGWSRSVVRRRTLEPTELAPEPGAVVCLCRSVGEGEIRSAARAVPPATTLDAVKRASGATFGDCQGNLCAVATAATLADAQGRSIASVEKHRAGSWLFLPGGVESGRGRAPGATQGLPAGVYDVVVIGGGLAGIGAALEAARGGLRTLIVERRACWGGALSGIREALEPEEAAAIRELERRLTSGSLHGLLGATAAGLAASDAGWEIQLQAPAGSLDVRASAVVLAAGGYVEPREHRPVAGPRSAGVATGDLVHAALDAGLLPGRVAVVVGRGRYADGTGRRLEAAGLAVHRAEGVVDALRGERRLESVSCDGRWVQGDLLVLADRLVPAPFLLRPLGLVDNRAGTPAPTDHDGRCPHPDLWAAGTCRQPDIGHYGSLTDGRLVGAAVARQSPVWEEARR